MPRDNLDRSLTRLFPSDGTLNNLESSHASFKESMTKSLCSLLLSLETPIGVQSVA